MTMLNNMFNLSSKQFILLYLLYFLKIINPNNLNFIRNVFYDEQSL